MSPVPHDPDIETVYLAAFTNEHANAVAEKLEEAGIAWWYKQPGFFSRIWEYGAVRLFVDKSRLEEAQHIAQEIAPDAWSG
jgi:hypothetical protein